MGVYVSVRGWLECDKEQLAFVKDVIAAHDDSHYAGGWAFPTKPVSWVHYVFYGGDIRESEVDWLLDQLKEIARIPASDEDQDEIRGFFVASHETEGSTEWKIQDGKVEVLPAKDRYQYLTK
jgi:hypothetical protein